jgi:tetratricopeptide (TPR) repeat protein
MARERLAAKDPRGALAVLSGGSDVTKTAEVHYLTSVARFQLGEFGLAETDARRAMSQDPGHAKAAYYLGLSLERQGRVGEAVRAYRAAASLDPTLEQARTKLQQFGVQQEVAPPAPPSPTRARETELELPDTDAEFDDYRRRVKRKAIIDARADYNAQMAGLPPWAWVLILLMVIFLVYSFVMASGLAG